MYFIDAININLAHRVSGRAIFGVSFFRCWMEKFFLMIFFLFTDFMPACSVNLRSLLQWRRTGILLHLLGYKTRYSFLFSKIIPFRVRQN